MKKNLKPIPKATKPSVMNLFWIGWCMILVGILKILDVVTGLVHSTININSSLVMFSSIFIVVGTLMLLFDRWLRRPREPRVPRKRVSETRAASPEQAANSEAGFTLIEVMIAIGMVALVFGMISGVLVSVLEVNKSIRERVDAEKIGHGVLGLLQRELQGCVAYGLGPVAFKGDNKNLSGSEADEIFFITTAPGDVFSNDDDQTANQNSSSSSSSSAGDDVKNTKPNNGPIYRKVAYVVRQAPSTSQTSRFVLCRRAVAYTKDDRDATSASGAPFVEVVDGIVDFKLEYRDGPDGNWQDSWTETNRLPSAIQISVRTAIPEDQILAANSEGRAAPEPKLFQTTVSLFASADIPETEETESTDSGN